MNSFQTRQRTGMGGVIGVNRDVANTLDTCNDHETSHPETWVNTGDTGNDCGEDPDSGDGVCTFRSHPYIHPSKR